MRIFIFLLLPFTMLAQQRTDRALSVTDKAFCTLPDSVIFSTDKIAGYIKSKTSTPEEFVRAAYVWTTSSIAYDVDRMFEINFNESGHSLIEKVLKTHKAICSGYSELFSEICTKGGIRSYVVQGYTKMGTELQNLPHAWVAAEFNDAFCLFDPTWGAGAVGGGKFIKRFTNEYYKVSPTCFVATHMPFDPMWQFLDHPVSHRRFTEAKVTIDPATPYFNYRDSIAAYGKKPELEQWETAAARMEQGGVTNALVFDRLSNLKRTILNGRENKKVERYNTSVHLYNDAVNLFNVYIGYRNKQFTPKKKDEEIRQMIDSVANASSQASLIVKEFSGDGALAANAQSLQKSLADLDKRVAEENKFVEKYIQTPRLLRKTLFQKLTWMGVPLN